MYTIASTMLKAMFAKPEDAVRPQPADAGAGNAHNFRVPSSNSSLIPGLTAVGIHFPSSSVLDGQTPEQAARRRAALAANVCAPAARPPVHRNKLPTPMQLATWHNEAQSADRERRWHQEAAKADFYNQMPNMGAHERGVAHIAGLPPAATQAERDRRNRIALDGLPGPLPVQRAGFEGRGGWVWNLEGSS